jgi:two-component system LytT family response regulator
MKIYLLDDEVHALDTLQFYTEQTPGLELSGMQTDPLKALDEIRNLSPDAVITDIHMPQLNGLDIAKLLPDSCRLVYSTSYREFAPEAFELAAVDYLLKPVGYARFLQCINRLRDQIPTNSEPEPDRWFVKAGPRGYWQSIALSEIRYIQGAENYVIIHHSGGQLMTYLTMAEVQHQLPLGSFCRIHKSYLVNWNHIRCVEPGRLSLGQEQWLTIGRTYREQFVKELSARGPKSSRVE